MKLKRSLMTAATLAVLVSMSACGGDDDTNESSDPGTSESSTAAETSSAPAPDDNAELCTQLSDGLARMTQFGTAISDPAAAGPSAQKVVDTLDPIEGAPAEVQTAVDAVVDGFKASIKPDGSFDVDAVATIAGPLQTSGATMQTYVTDECAG